MVAKIFEGKNNVWSVNELSQWSHDEPVWLQHNKKDTTKNEKILLSDMISDWNKGCSRLYVARFLVVLTSFWAPIQNGWESQR